MRLIYAEGKVWTTLKLLEKTILSFYLKPFIILSVYHGIFFLYPARDNHLKSYQTIINLHMAFNDNVSSTIGLAYSPP